MPVSCGVGIDVAKDVLDVAWSTEPNARWRTTNDDRGWAAVIDRLQPLQPDVVGDVKPSWQLWPNDAFRRNLASIMTTLTFGLA